MSLHRTRYRTRTILSIARRWTIAGAMLTVALATRGTAQRTAQRTATHAAPRTVKAIWEPVNYGEDINLGSVFFVTPLLGWVAGEHGTILRTTDGGAHWTAQLGGDAKSQDEPLDGLRFVDDTHGWATERYPQTASKLLRTTDGEQWEQVGAIPHVSSSTYTDYAFTSASNGAALVGSKIFITRNGGKDWQDVFTCAAKVEVNGLARNVDCSLQSLSFVSADVGYALGGNRDVADKVFIVKTTDGGRSWSVQIADGATIEDKFRGPVGQVAFSDARRGIICNYNGRLFATADSGTTWHGVAGTGGSSSIAFTDPEVAFSVDGNRVSYTADGGSRWLSREFSFPSAPKAFAAPRRDRAYLVGDHGMVYTYHIVQAAYSPPKIIEAPIVAPAPSAFETAIGHLELETSALDSAIVTDATASPSVQPGVGPGVPGTSAKRMSSLQLAFAAVTGLLPDFLAKYRNLSLVVLGLRMAGALPDKTDSVKSAFAAFTQAADPQTARSALAQLSASLRALTQVADTALQITPAPAGAPATN